MRVVSVNVGQAASLQHGGKSLVTGICKRPLTGAVTVTSAGLADDVICDKEHHGGADQAVYAYSAEDYKWWTEQLGRSIDPGTFGDNLTISDLPDDMQAGERLLIGSVILEATSPRIPCSTLAARMRDRNFGLAFRRAERPGVYFRVLNGGTVSAGDVVMPVENEAPTVSMLELFRLSYEIRPPASELQRALAAPIAERMRANFETKLASLT